MKTVKFNRGTFWRTQIMIRVPSPLLYDIAILVLRLYYASTAFS